MYFMEIIWFRNANSLCKQLWILRNKRPCSDSGILVLCGEETDAENYAKILPHIVTMSAYGRTSLINSVKMVLNI
jgi:hypothetical protein